MNVKKLIAKLQLCDTQYDIGESKLSDSQYDKLRLKAEKLMLTTDQYRDKLRLKKYLSSVGRPEDLRSDVDLPVIMGSLNKIMTNTPNKLSIWLKKLSVVCIELVLMVTPKIDGASFLLHYRNGLLVGAFSRGTGIAGKYKLDKARVLVNTGAIPDKIRRNTKYRDIFIRGEIVIPTKKFKYWIKKGYTNPTNMVSGWMNSDEFDPSLEKTIKFLVYDVMLSKKTVDTFMDSETLTGEWDNDYISMGSWINKDSSKVNKPSVLTKLGKQGFNVVKPLDVIRLSNIDGKNIDELNKTLTSILKRAKPNKKFDFEQDGIVVEPILYSHSQKLHSTTSNPLRSNRAFAYKLSSDDDVYHKSTVTKVEWNTSKQGSLVPLVYFDQVTIDNSKITKAAGNNARNCIATKLLKGTKIGVVKAGGVIPKIVYTKSTKLFKDIIKSLPKKCGCGAKSAFVHSTTGKFKYVESIKSKDNIKKDYHVHIYCTEPEKCKYVQSALLRVALTRIDGIGKKVVDTLVNNGYTSIESVLKLRKKSLLEIDGIGPNQAKLISKDFVEYLSELDIAELAVVSGIFTSPIASLADKTSTVIFDHIGKTKKVKMSDLMISGINIQVRKLFVAKYSTFLKWKKSINL